MEEKINETQSTHEHVHGEHCNHGHHHHHHHRTEPVRRESPKVGRNEPCPCGSGEKYKRCHGKEV